MKRYKGLLAALLAATVAVACLRLFFAMILVIPADGERPALYAGDRVWVSRMAYGVRLPLSRWWGYKRVGASPAAVGDWVAFNNPASAPSIRVERREVYVGRCLGQPGDTLWLDGEGRVSRPCGKPRTPVFPIVVPARGQRIKVEAWSAPLYEKAINDHEPVKAAVIDDSLCVDGRMSAYYRFNQDFYWMESSSASGKGLDSRTFGFVPETHLIGRLVRVLYSLDASAPWYHSVRKERVGIPLP